LTISESQNRRTPCGGRAVTG